MKTSGTIGMVLAATLALGGCVSDSKFNAAVAESEAARTDLERVRAQKNALEQQVKSLRDLNAKLSDDVKLASSELQRIKDIRDKERASIEARIHDLEVKSKDLLAQHKTLQREYDDLRTQNSALKATVSRYQKELKERQQALAPSPPSVSSPTPASKPMEPSAANGSSAKPGGQAGVSVAPSSKGGLTPVNLNTASSNDMVLFLGLTKDVADKVVMNRPYRLKGELMAKNVLPRSTFDVIKDRVTAAP